MRFAIAVLASAVAQLLFFLRFAASADSSNGYFGFFYIVLATVGAGWFAIRRSALAGALSVMLAALMDAVVILAGPAGQGMGALEVVASIASFIVAFWPYIGIGAIGGALGGAVRARILAAR